MSATRNTFPRDEPPSGLAGGKAVKVDRVEVIWFPSKQTAINALAKGEIDLWRTSTPTCARCSRPTRMS